LSYGDPYKLGVFYKDIRFQVRDVS